MYDSLVILLGLLPFFFRRRNDKYKSCKCNDEEICLPVVFVTLSDGERCRKCSAVQPSLVRCEESKKSA